MHRGGKEEACRQAGEWRARRSCTTTGLARWHDEAHEQAVLTAAVFTSGCTAAMHILHMYQLLREPGENTHTCNAAEACPLHLPLRTLG